MSKVVVLGANGQLGSDLCPQLVAAGHELIALTHANLEICDQTGVFDRLSAIGPATVINTTAFHKVEACEEEIDRAFAVNCYAVRALAETCNRIGARLVHVSTDYVFGGDQMTPYAEDSALRPLNAYGVSKAAGEYFLRSVAREHLLIRSSGLFGVAGASGKGGNFVETMLRLGRERGTVSVVTDQVLSPTSTVDLGAKITELVSAGAQGVFHVTNAWACSWFEFARTIFDLASLAVEVVPVTTEQMGFTVARPSYSVLGNYRLKADGFQPLRPGRDALRDYLEARAGKRDSPTH